VTTTFSLIKEQQAAAGEQFGAVLRRWRIACGFTQYTIPKWIAEAGLGLTISGISEIERGLTRHPRVSFYITIGAINRLLYEQDFRGLRSRDLIDQVKGGRAITDEDGRPWGAGDFWELRAGIKSPPDWLAPVSASPAPALTAEDAEALCAGWADQVRQLARAAGLGAAGMEQAQSVAPAEERDRWGEVLTGFGSYSPEDLAELWDPIASEWVPGQWVQEWRALLPNGGGGGGVIQSSELMGC
jgi:transcriptional regulator with XRE-family HTH domain